jgi:hypothetical protein
MLFHLVVSMTSQGAGSIYDNFAVASDEMNILVIQQNLSRQWCLRSKGLQHAPLTYTYPELGEDPCCHFITITIMICQSKSAIDPAPQDVIKTTMWNKGHLSKRSFPDQETLGPVQKISSLRQATKAHTHALLNVQRSNKLAHAAQTKKLSLLCWKQSRIQYKIPVDCCRTLSHPFTTSSQTPRQPSRVIRSLVTLTCSQDTILRWVPVC